MNNLPEFRLFRTTRLLLPSLTKRGWGRFLNKSRLIPFFQREKLFLARSLEAIELNQELAEKLDAFASRFCRLQDTLGDKLLPAYLRMQLEPVGTALDNLNRAEKLGLIPSVENWIQACNLRNNLVQEYTEDIELLRRSIKRAIELVPMLQTVANNLIALSV